MLEGREVVVLGGRVMIVEPAVIAPPCVSVALPIRKPEFLKSAVTLEVPITTTPGRASVVVDKMVLTPLFVGEGVGVTLVVAPLIIIADPDGATEIRSPLTVASEPGLMVRVPMTKSEVL